MHSHLSWMDGVSIGSIVGAVTGHLPGIATALAVLWYGTQLFGFFRDERERRRVRQPIPCPDADRTDEPSDVP